MDDALERFIIGMPKIELHVHLEGTLEPEMMFDLAQRNGVTLPFKDVEDVKKAYEKFDGLDGFIPLYLQGMHVLKTEEDFHDLTKAYLKKMASEHCTHTEMFFDPQGHTDRRDKDGNRVPSVPFEAVMHGIRRAMEEAETEGFEVNGKKVHVTSKLHMSFLRDRSEKEAFETLDEAKPYIEAGYIHGIGLDNPEAGNEPSKFKRVFAEAKKLYPELKLMAHVCEEGPAEYGRQALDDLHIDRGDHGYNLLQDPALAARYAEEKIGLTACPVCRQMLGGIEKLEDYPYREMESYGLQQSFNSDDPGYLGARITKVFLLAADALNLTRDDIIKISHDTIDMSFLSPEKKAEKHRQFDEYVRDFAEKERVMERVNRKASAAQQQVI